ncbi:hypothetical protein EGW08_011040 [Elysia chlorotica]|uniref:HAT C-terminal dimerisation domain-containing protein n=1 Tax=Elysia chlorotica TaxID=188477 RepID=A0A3S1BI12_ELYCH|nr:hypothetical protein EGW08_011040 [Elysia chlorotica]
MLQGRLHTVATDLLMAFMKPSAITDAEDIYSIQHSRRSKQKDREELSIGDATRTYLEAGKGNGLSNTAITEFFEDARSFYSTSMKYIFEKMPMQQEELEKAKFWMSASARMLCMQTSNSGSKDLTSLTNIDKAVGALNMNERVDVLWPQISQMKTDEGDLQYPQLASIMKGLLCIPHSNADAERVFSIVRKNKTEARASMSRQLLSDTIVLKARMSSRDEVCHSLQLDRNVLLKTRNSSQ